MEAGQAEGGGGFRLLAGVVLAALEDEAAVAIAALDHVIVAHLVPDDGMPQRAIAAIAGDTVLFGDDRLRCVRQILSGHVRASPMSALPVRRCDA